jgi:hypothetical protein
MYLNPTDATAGGRRVPQRHEGGAQRATAKGNTKLPGVATETGRGGRGLH